ncbi:hypothetical protein HG536_0F03410 [Torulaspora globosa]|uniref:Temperature shock-inducible protein 1 n=1 Tax=Torulaspora globosa TaxID=48254 RepID=A0A7G3ZKI0_9SACH|nr:uncharacterized protein HG536_0F03410 [Torulaspora globosa]QLL34016.1 hypothetical protein HG536_0F03410 [Torulaspora globosa]
MHFSTLTALALIIAPLVSADSNADAVEFQAILSDVNNHLSDYISLAVNDPSFTVPSGVLDVYTQMTTYTDDAYTTLFSQLDFSSINAVMTALPWYSSRLEPEIQSAFKANSITDTSIGPKVTDSASSMHSSSNAVSTTTASSGKSNAVSTVTASSGSSAASETTSVSSTSSADSSTSSVSLSSTTSSAPSSTKTSSHSAAANLNELNTILGIFVIGSVAMFF